MVIIGYISCYYCYGDCCCEYFSRFEFYCFIFFLLYNSLCMSVYLGFFFRFEDIEFDS